MNTDDVVIWFTYGEDLWSHTLRSYGHYLVIKATSVHNCSTHLNYSLFFLSPVGVM
jgi:hypothetical protein